ncbi:GTPase Obg [Candidatus Clavichlamydia salmonicola]|uniref:GTPase ObgE n=1 Tax=Candidatus Clavichlamydia salmonicola TaxID=469812 RepID=UPI0018915D05|nr:GTPase ObgE [Candidatus Clavichlamydia salmonicola]MBF5051057.1 GTPase Obg [Candidatus Clavichlamydia salmonicola]
MFVDCVSLELKAGKGGNGVVAWRREKYLPKGGPYGGNGGPGGAVIISSDPQIYCLDRFRNIRILRAEDGGHGAPNNKQGRRGKDLVLKLPQGTLVKNAETGALLCDLSDSQNNKVFLCKGGKGGKGNTFFKNALNRAPNYATQGEMGDYLSVEFELKLIADVGLVGFPNAGKSTLIGSLTNAQARIGAYPFTTLKPFLGFISDGLPYGDRFAVADIPGIIEGAHLNKGLGCGFLRHIERTKILLFIIDISGFENRDPLKDFEILLSELELHGAGLENRECLVALNKTDIEMEETIENIKRFKQRYPHYEIIEISGLCGVGLDYLTEILIQKLKAQKKEAEALAATNLLFSLA